MNEHMHDMPQHDHMDRSDQTNTKQMTHDMPSEHAGHEGHMTASPSGHEHGAHNHHQMMADDFKKRFFISLALTVPILLLSPMIQSLLGADWRFAGDSWILTALSTAIFIYGGRPFLKGAVDELKKRSPAMMMLITLAICVAYLYSTLNILLFHGRDFFWELATLIVIMLLGHWIEMRSVMGASMALDEIVKLMPDTANVILEDGAIVERETSGLKAGDKVLIKPGEKVPIDGIVFEGESSVSEAMITGESLPVQKKAGDDVTGGSVNGEGILKMTVSRTGEDTFLSQVAKLVRDAQASKSKTQRLADQAAKWLFYIAVTASTVTFIVWFLISANAGYALERAVTVIIISCPHALGLAIPLVTSVSTGIAAKRGLLIRDRAAFEDARRIDTVLFDKTGTLTEGRFGVTDVKTYGITEGDLLKIACSIEINSEHPIAKGIVEEGKKRGIEIEKITGFQNITGRGLKAIVNEREVIIASPSYLSQQHILFDEAALGRLTSQGKTVIFLLSDGEVLGYIALADVIRESAFSAIEQLRSLGIESYMLTGDQEKTALYVAGKLGIRHVTAQVLPEEKSLKIDELHRLGKHIAMTGDGVNDAPALAKADLGIAIGAGTDVAVETADVVLVRSDPEDVINLLKLSRATYRKMRQNLVWATAYNVVALPLAAGILIHQGIVISPALGAALMSLSTIIVSINARFLRIK